MLFDNVLLVLSRGDRGRMDRSVAAYRATHPALVVAVGYQAAAQAPQVVACSAVHPARRRLQSILSFSSLS